MEVFFEVMAMAATKREICLVLCLVLGVGAVAYCALKMATLGRDAGYLSLAVLQHCGPQWDSEIAALKTRIKSLEDAADRRRQRLDEKRQVRIAKAS